jgi:hypothetical protein
MAQTRRGRVWRGMTTRDRAQAAQDIRINFSGFATRVGEWRDFKLGHSRGETLCTEKSLSKPEDPLERFGWI